MIELLYAEFGHRDFRTGWIPEKLLAKVVKQIGIDPDLDRNGKNGRIGRRLSSLEGEIISLKKGGAVTVRVVEGPANPYGYQFYRFETV